MSTDPLPRSLDVRKAAARGVERSGTLAPTDLPRFNALLADSAGTLQANLAFAMDDENRPVVEVQVSGSVQVTCQRCLHPMPLELAGGTRLGVVWNDDQAKQLPRHLEPLVIGEEACDLWELVEEELILLLPQFSYHEIEECNESLSAYSGAPEEEGPAKKPNPFEVLAQLKTDK